MTKALPFFFETKTTTKPGIDQIWTSQAPGLDPVPIAIPPEFSGPGKGYSPEDLFAMACVNCMIATFKVYAEHMRLSFQEITAKTTLTVDKHPAAAFLSMTNIDVAFTLKGPSDPEKVKNTLEKAIKDCAVCNSIKSVKTYSIHLE